MTKRTFKKESPVVRIAPFFVFRELGRVLAEAKIRALFFRSRATASGEVLEATKEV